VTNQRDRLDEGNAIIEFLYLAVLLMVPLVYVLLSVFAVQRATYATSSAAREAGRVFATSSDVSEADARAATAARIVLADSGLDAADVDLRVNCSSRPCLAPGSRVEVRIRYDVALPLLPRLFDGAAPATIRTEGRHVEVVDRFRQVRR
jgi:Flp pilus assembly protein TadG